MPSQQITTGPYLRSLNVGDVRRVTGATATIGSLDSSKTVLVDFTSVTTVTVSLDPPVTAYGSNVALYVTNVPVNTECTLVINAVPDTEFFVNKFEAPDFVDAPVNQTTTLTVSRVDNMTQLQLFSDGTKWFVHGYLIMKAE
jgi:hypothetical protein